jgi:hypothetical protein
MQMGKKHTRKTRSEHLFDKIIVGYFNETYSRATYF